MRRTEFKTFARIALDLGIDEKTAREGFRSYTEEIAPTLVNSDAMLQAVEFIGKYEAAQEWYAKVVADEKEATVVRMQALKHVMETMSAEITLRQEFGFLPKNLGTVRVEMKARYIIERVFDVVEKYDMPDAALDELEQIIAQMKAEGGKVPIPVGAKLN
jgi:hypothetical protein